MSLKRVFDMFLSLLLCVALFLPLLFISLAIKLTSDGPVFYMSDRVGRKNRIFRMCKFRTMKNDTPAVATHLLRNPEAYVTSIGYFLRRTSLDELPQLFNILKGDMSFVGPRPALYNQDDLVSLRTKKGIDELLPGLTGWAQINGRDELPIPVKVGFDEYYKDNLGFFFDLKILLLTFLKVLKKEGITH